MPIIYKSTNLVNNKIYIGQCSDLGDRKNTRKYGALSGTKNAYFDRAIRKYGWESFVFAEIDRGGTPKEIDEKEKCWIKFYKSNDRNIGYNLAEGGRVNRGFKKTEEQKLKQSERQKKAYAEGRLKPWNKGKKCPENSGIYNHNFGKKMSDETRRKVRESRKGKHVGENHWTYGKTFKNPRKNKKVRCIETNVIYPSITEASDILQIPRGHISSVCKGSRSKCGGFSWEHIND